MPIQARVALSLLMLRLTVALVFLMWTINKFVRPENAINIYETFFFIPSLIPNLVFVIASLELVLVIAFAIGFQQRYTYMAILIFHSLSTFASWLNYFEPFKGPNLLFFTAWPMLAACGTLVMLQRWDTWLTVSSVRKALAARN